MIYFDNWNIRHDGSLFARQYDNLSRRLDVTGNLPEGWSWEMLVQTQDAFDIIPLSAIDGGVGTVLSEQQLSLSGFYTLQLRATQDSVVKHTNILQVFIPASLSGTAHWPELPSSFLETERRIKEMGLHPPVLEADGYWSVWDPLTSSYKKTTTELTAELIKPNSTEAWKLIADIEVTQSIHTILNTFVSTPMRKILVMLNTPSVTQSAPAITITALTATSMGGIRDAASIELNPATIPTTYASSNIYEIEVVSDGDTSAFAKVRANHIKSPYNRTQENSAGNPYTSYAIGYSSNACAIWQPWDVYGRTIKNQITGFQAYVSTSFPVGTRIKIWGVEK